MYLPHKKWKQGGIMWSVKIFILISMFFIVSCENKAPKKDIKIINSNKLKTKIQKDIKFLKSIENKYKDSSYSIKHDKDFKLNTVILEKADILYFNSRLGNNLLLLAIIFEKNELVKYLINKKLDINKKMHPFWNNIFSAIIISGNLELTKFFIENKKAKTYYYSNNNKFNILNNMLNIDGNEVNWYPKSLISEYIKIIDYMYKNKLLKLKDLTSEHEFYGSLWYKSLRYGILELYQHFIYLGFDINYINKSKQNALTIAILYGGVARLVSRHMGDKKKIKYYDVFGNVENRFNLIKYLIENKININNIDNNNKTALDYSLEILNENEKNELYEKNIINLLKKHGAKRACEILKIKCEPIKGDK
jgi:ankyrin repeat protein